MKKWLFFLLAITVFFSATIVFAQDNARFAEMSVQLWPEYDKPEMLVMYSFSVTEDTALPVDVNMRIPANVILNAVAKQHDDGMVKVPYSPPVQDGDMQVLTIVVDELTLYRLEYYEPMQRDGSTRSYSFIWENELNVENLFVEFLEPTGLRNFNATPSFVDSVEEDGMRAHAFSAGMVEAGAIFDVEISYEKDDDTLSVSSMPIEVSGVPESGAAESLTIADSMPMLLASLGVVLVLGGLLFYFMTGRDANLGMEKRKRHKSSGKAKYCHECGSSANGSDKFCRSCGVKLRN